MKYLKRFESVEIKEDKYLIKIECANNQVSLKKWINDYDSIDEYQKNEAEKWWSCSIYNICKVETRRRSDSNLSNWEIALLERQPRRVVKEQNYMSNGIILRLIREDIVNSRTNLIGFQSLELDKKVDFLHFLNDSGWLIKDGIISKVFNESEINFELDNFIDYYQTQIINPA
jgi:hypothetical protein